MASRDSGTVRPTKRKHVFLAAAVLLLVCVLAAGAVSAERTVFVNYDNFNDAIKTTENTTIIITEDIHLLSGWTTSLYGNITLTTEKNKNYTISGGSSSGTIAKSMFIVPDGKYLTIIGNETGTLTLNGSSGGVQNFVKIESGGYFTLENGGILANNTRGDGGAVYMNGGTFTMKGGSIVNNTATNGRAVYVDDGTFTMEGGIIANNTATDGGAVYMNGGTFMMKGGIIANNTASEHGGGVHMKGGIFTMSGGTIANNTATSGFGGALYVDGNNKAVDITLSGTAKISNNTATNGGGVFMKGSGTKITLVRHCRDLQQQSSGEEWGHVNVRYRSRGRSARR